jgi:hypothetical protein
MSDELDSIRGLVEGGTNTPLRRFIGLFKGNQPEQKTGNTGTYVQNNLQFADIEVLESVEPYNFPTATIGISGSNRKSSKWGVFADSLVTLLDAGIPEGTPDEQRKGLKDCFDHKIGMVFADGQEGRPEPPKMYNGAKKAEVPTPVWMAYSFDGQTLGTGGVKSVEEILYEKLDGHTITEFNGEALAEELVRNSPEFLQKVSKPVGDAGNFATEAVAAGKFSLDAGGVYRRIL